jgi:hypothetical protein
MRCQQKLPFSDRIRELHVQILMVRLPPINA